ncbi:DNA (cytosine-5-)-methyltransferase [Bacteriovorax sp. BSW11_IV]|uniref:DNA cytosine methyltransferase n=1 Tax=Bacteriovorax sp. BSW11_IV TaxID=1353529 RepID=UPI00038A052D|nr:DNA (cytosine-5-)-methyltransferase [Bacteriovorax sp. BSW11_IV]EQC44539.1 DNA (cytosine-5-)-methyltransferase [Bacteriovorax sp. BSW11_IV]
METAINKILKSKKSKELTLRYGEFFSGPGGLGLGASKASLEVDGIKVSFAHEWVNDIDLDSCHTYYKNVMKDHGKTFHGDIREFDFNKLTPVDAFAYGFPCNDFSIVGEHKGFNGEYGPLYTYGIKVLNKFNPVFFLAENVGGLASANQGKAFKAILSDLSQAGKHGYDIVPHLYKFEEYGVPQARHRIIMIGIRRDLGVRFKVPRPTHNSTNFVTSLDAINKPRIKKDAHNNELTKQSAQVIERLKYIKPGKNVWDCEDDMPEHLRINSKKTRLSQIYKRLDPNKPSYTITGSGGGGTHGYHWDEDRALTNRERARLQTFPDDFVFEGSKESVRKQIGMAVSPKMAEILFNSVLKCLAGVEYPSINARWEDWDQ